MPWIIIVLLGLACAPRPLLVRHDWVPEEGVGAVLERSAASLAELDNMRAEARINFRQQGRRQGATALVLFKAPDRFKMEVRGPLFTHVFTALVEGDSITVLSGGQAWKGVGRGPLLGRLAGGLELGGYDLRYALLGLVEAGLPTEVEYSRADRAVASVGTDPGRRVWVDLHRGFVRREELLLAPGVPLWQRYLRKYRRVGDLYLPGEIEIIQGDTVVELKYRDYDFDRVLEDKHFALEIPDAQIRRVD